MRYPPGHKQRTRARILDAAGRLFRRMGYHAAGVDAVMKEAGLTPGGFYAHFENKEALLAEALIEAVRQSRDVRGRWLQDASGREWLERFVQVYLSPEHRASRDEGCPIPALLPEIGRSGEGTRQAFESMTRCFISEIAAHLPEGETPEGIDRIIAAICLCAGGLSASRAVADEAFAEQILGACRRAASDILLAKPADPRPDED